jgi:hypothetical protein
MHWDPLVQRTGIHFFAKMKQIMKTPLAFSELEKGTDCAFSHVADGQHSEADSSLQRTEFQIAFIDIRREDRNAHVLAFCDIHDDFFGIADFT